jgi:hypothetical protein
MNTHVSEQAVSESPSLQTPETPQVQVAKQNPSLSESPRTSVQPTLSQSPIQESPPIPIREQSSPPIQDPVTPTGSDPSDQTVQVPGHFLAAEGGDYKKALNRWKETLAFRQRHQMDNLLTQPHRHFRAIKNLYPHFYHKRTRQGHIVYYEAPGVIDIKVLEKLQLNVEDLFWHYLYLSEFLWKEIETSESTQVLTVVDMKGVSVSDVASNGKVLEYIRRISDCSRDHYPGRSFMIFMINVPKWFSFVWKHVLSPLLDAKTRARTHIYGSDYLQALTEFIPLPDIPEAYGGKCRCQRGDCRAASDIELSLVSHVKKYYPELPS